MKRFLKAFFSFSRKEQLGILVLIALIIIVLVLRSLLPGWQSRAERDFSEYREQIDRFEESISGSGTVLPGDSVASQPGDPVASLPRQPGERAGSQDPERPSSEAVMININSADSIELQQIRGIGPVLSKRIVKYRYLLGGFVSREQLKEVYGIDDERYNQIENQFYTDTSGIRHMDLNKVDQYTLARHPYLNESQAGAIINYRKLKGSIAEPERLLEEYILDEEVYRKISPYLVTK